MAKHLVRKREHPVDFRDGGRVGDDLDEDVDALGLVLELVREGATSPAVDPADGPARLANRLRDTVGRRLDFVLVEAGIEDDGDFVGPQGGSPPPDPESLTPGAPESTGAGVDMTGSW